MAAHRGLNINEEYQTSVYELIRYSNEEYVFLMDVVSILPQVELSPKNIGKTYPCFIIMKHLIPFI